MNSKIASFFVVAIFALAGTLHAQQPKTRVTDADVASINVSIRAQVRAMADSALTEKLGAEAILDWARELTAKRIPGGRIESATIARAVAARLSYLRAVQKVLGPDATEADINAGAVALSAGANIGAISEIAKSRKGSAELFGSFSILSDLVTYKVPLDTAVHVVSRMAAAGIREGDLTALRKAVVNDIALGRLPAVAASTRVEGIIQAANGNHNAADNDFARGPGPRAPGRPPIPPMQN